MLSKENIVELKTLLPNKIIDSMDEIKKHSGNLFYTSNNPPDAICYPENEEDVLTIVNYCLQNRIPLIPYGSGTSVEGHTTAIHGGICLDMSKMSSILAFSQADLTITVQAGIPYNELNNQLEPIGFYFPVEAGWGASIGGMTATNASGAGATDAGSMSKNVMSCGVVIYQNGKAIKVETGTLSPKTSAGLNLTGLYVGSEGTLGIITTVTLRLRKKFSHSQTIICQFDEIDKAVNFVVDMKGKVQFRKIELMDKLQTNACISYSGIKNLSQDKNTLIIELAGNELAVQEETNMVTSNLKNYPAQNIKVMQDKKASEEIWMMRKNACPAAIKYIDPNKKAMATDVSVPLSKLSECVKNCHSIMTKLEITAPLVAHVGDGNFHFTILLDPNDKFEKDKAMLFNNLVVEEALRLGGTCSGEHGIGIGKSRYLAEEHKDTIFMMKAIKQSLDPYDIFNPGKLFNAQNVFTYKNKNITDVSIYSEAEPFRRKMIAKM